VEIPNAFIGKREKPTEEELSSVLGASAKPWNEFVAWLAEEQGVAIQEWKSYSPKAGWALRLSLKKRNIVYLAPCQGCFRVAFILGNRAVKAALESDLPAAVVNAIKDAPKYSEGTGVRLMVKRPSDLPALRKIALAKLAN
jgi:hypothetical protein